MIVENARWCDGFFSKMRGFTFRWRLKPGEGLVLVESSEGKVSAGVTMLFCFLDLAVIWLDAEGKVVDKVLAKPWRPSYMPKAPAQYVVETEPTMLEHVNEGDYLQFNGGPE
ncbi:MAG: DUF192 domain-containing protein [Candidatus Promineifilaceae bacterium]